MALANCSSCGALFNRVHQEYCPKCVRELDEQFILVRDYLKNNRNAFALEISEATGVPFATILKFIREGRLTAVHGSNLSYPCERCEAPITSGTYCKSCADDLKGSLASAKASLAGSVPNDQKGAGYHIRNPKF